MPAKKKKAAKKELTKLTKSVSEKSESTLERKYEKYKKALEAAGGFISQTAELLGVTHQAVSLYIKAHPELQELRKSIDEFYLDLAENALLVKVKKGNMDAIKFYLRCKGKDRGYIEKSEIDLTTPGDPVKVMLDDVGKRIEGNPKLKASLEKETED